MRITALGCFAPYPPAGGACSSYVVQDGAGKVLLDLGHGVFSHLVELFDPLSIEAIILTHLHPDHYADLPCLRHAILGGFRSGKLKRGKVSLFLPSEPRSIAQEITKYNDAFEITFIEDLPKKEVPDGVEVHYWEMGPVQFFFLPVKHILPTYAIAVEGSGYFVYSADTAVTKDLELLAHKADILLCEASGLDKDEKSLSDFHMTARQAGELSKRALVKELILTHFYPEYDLEELRKQAQEGYGAKVELATEGDTYFVY